MMWNVWILLITVVLTILLVSDSVSAEEETIKCNVHYKCVPLSLCQIYTEGDIFYPCNEEETSVCCLEAHLVNSTSVAVRTSAFPETCGFLPTDDRITGGETASIGQFPWITLLGYKLNNLNLTQFLCGGSLITEQYVLTAAHCIFIDPRLKLQLVRFGEFDLKKDIDCEEIDKQQICGDPHVDVPIAKVMVHEEYNNRSLRHDIALIKLQHKVNFTDYIQPICLPFQKDIHYKTAVGAKLVVSGWGKTDSANVGGSPVLQFAKVSVWDRARCNRYIPPRIRPIRESQLCANGVKRQDSCKGDSGGPLTNATLINNDLKTYQIGIVSFSSAQVCGNAELPTIYTRVDHYLNWIVTNVN